MSSCASNCFNTEVGTHVGKLIFTFLVSTKLPCTAQDRHAPLAFNLHWNGKKQPASQFLGKKVKKS